MNVFFKNDDGIELTMSTYLAAPLPSVRKGSALLSDANDVPPILQSLIGEPNVDITICDTHNGMTLLMHACDNDDLPLIRYIFEESGRNHDGSLNVNLQNPKVLCFFLRVIFFPSDFLCFVRLF